MAVCGQVMILISFYFFFFFLSNRNSFHNIKKKAKKPKKPENKQTQNPNNFFRVFLCFYWKLQKVNFISKCAYVTCGLASCHCPEHFSDPLFA